MPTSIPPPATAPVPEPAGRLDALLERAYGGRHARLPQQPSRQNSVNHRATRPARPAATVGRLLEAIAEHSAPDAFDTEAVRTPAEGREHFVIPPALERPARGAREGRGTARDQ